jgi:Fe-S-cluster containining protein
MILMCGNCHLCCELQDLVVNVHSSEAPKLDIYFTKLTEPNIKKNQDGSCVYLGSNGCTIYNERPNVCQTFTCERFLNPDHTHYNQATIDKTLNPLRKAAKLMLQRHKQSIAQRFNNALK